MADEFPDKVHASELTVLVAGLLRGRVALLAWEEVGGPGSDLDAWELDVREVSFRAGVTACPVRLEQPRMTVVYNESYPPTEEYIRTMVAQREAEREAAAKKGNPPAEPAPQ